MRTRWLYTLISVLACGGIAQAATVTTASSACPTGTLESSTNLMSNPNFATQPSGPFPIAAGGSLAPAGFTSGFIYLGNNLYPGDNRMSIQTGVMPGGRPGYSGAVAQDPFPGDPSRGVPAINTYLYSDGNTTGAPLLIFNRSLSGLTPGGTYNFSAYISNALKVPANATVLPNITFRLNGTALGVNEVIANETSVDTWRLVQRTFTAPPTGTGTLTLTDSALGSNGDDFVITGIAVAACQVPLERIGLAKKLVSLTNLQDGTFSAIFDLTASNAGASALSALQISDTLALGTQTGSAPSAGQYKITASAIQSTSNSGTATINPAYTGVAPNSGLLSGGALPNFGANPSTVTVRLTVQFHPGNRNTNPSNSATATATAPTGTVSDVSNDNLADGNSDGNPNNDSNATPIVLPASVGLAKRLLSAVPVAGNKFDLKYELNLVNTGPRALNTYSLNDVLIGTTPFTTGEGSGGDLGLQNITVTATIGGSTAVPVAAYTATGANPTLLTGSLPIGSSVTATVTVRIKPLAGAHNNTATVTATTPDGLNTTDSSTNGTNPRAGNATLDPNNPANNIGTPFNVGTVSGQAFHDVNGDASPTGELAIGTGVSITTPDGVITGPLAADGTYSLNVPKGNASVSIVGVPSGAIRTVGTEPTPITVAGATSAGLDGFKLPGSITGTVYIDSNANGSRDLGEPGLANVSLTITPVSGPVQTVTTGPAGTYSASVAPGSTTASIVAASIPSGYNLSAGVTSKTLIVPSGGTINAGLTGYSPAGTISGVLFIDTNGNGSKDLGEAAFPGVGVVITPASGPAISVVTNASGAYSSGPIAPGVGTVSVTPGTVPAGYVLTGASPQGVTLTTGTNATAAPIGYQPKGTVSGTIFIDTNGNGSRDVGEPALPNISLTLTPTNGPVQTLTSNASGVYSASLAAGSSTIAINPASLPAGYVLSSGVASKTVTVGLNTNTNAGLTGYTPKGNLSGILFADNNGNGSKDIGEPALTGVGVVITPSTGPAITSVTDGSGTYRSGPIPIGPATVTVTASTVPAGYTLTGTTPQTLTVTAGNTGAPAPIGYQPVGTLSGTVFIDSNGNGARDPGEPALPRIVMVLSGAGQATQTATSNASGVYSFANIQPGAVTVAVQSGVPAGYSLTAGVASKPITVPTPASGNIDAGLIGYKPNAALGGKIWNDTNGNGTLEAGEPGLANVSVIITPSSGPAITAITDASGNYTVPSLPLGNASVTVLASSLPAGSALTSAALPITVPIVAGANTAANIGYQPRGTLTGRVFRDADRSASENAGDSALPAVNLVVTDALGTAHPVTTNASGDWSLSNLPVGTSTILVSTSSLPAGFVLTAGTQPLSATVKAGTTASTPLGYELGSGVNGVIFNDANSSATPDPTETGRSGILVTLTPTAGGTSYTATTRPDGTYTIYAPAGAYTLTFNQPAGTKITTANPTQPVTVVAGLKLAAPIGLKALASLSGTIYNDLNHNKIQDDDEPGLENVSVRISSTTATVVILTDSGGRYTAPIEAGTATVTSTAPNGFAATTPEVNEVEVIGNTNAPDVGYALAILKISKVALGNALPGQTLVWRITVSNPNNVALYNVTITDLLPASLSFGSKLVSNGTNYSVLINGRTLSFKIDSLAANTSQVFDLPTPVRGNVRSGDKIENTASASATIDGQTIDAVQSNRAVGSAKVTTPERGGTLIGYVYIDSNNNQRFDNGDLPVANRVIALDDGRQASSDAQGRYSFADVPNGSHVIVIAAGPGRLETDPNDLGLNGTRRVLISDAGLYRVDFAFIAETAAAAKSRSTHLERGPVNLEKTIVATDGGYLISLTVTISADLLSFELEDPLALTPLEAPKVQINGQASSVQVNGLFLNLRLGNLAAGSTIIISYLVPASLDPVAAMTDPNVSYQLPKGLK